MQIRTRITWRKLSAKSETNSFSQMPKITVYWFCRYRCSN